MELGILIQGGKIPIAVKRHFLTLIGEKILRPYAASYGKRPKKLFYNL